MEIIKTIFWTFLLIITMLCGFGGGVAVFGIPLMWIFQPSPTICDIIIAITALVPIPFAWHFAPKIYDKF